jgi:hypothetical protein
LQRLNEAERLEALTKTLHDAKHFGPVITTLGHFAAEPREDGRYPSLLANPESREVLKKACLERIRLVASEGSGTSVDEFLEVIGYWGRWDPEAAQSWVVSYLVSRVAVVKFLQNIQSSADGTGGPKKFIQVATFENIIPTDILLEKIDTYLTGEWTSDEMELVGMLKSAIKRREDGTENNPLAIFQD